MKSMRTIPAPKKIKLEFLNDSKSMNYQIYKIWEINRKSGIIFLILIYLDNMNSRNYINIRNTNLFYNFVGGEKFA